MARKVVEEEEEVEVEEDDVAEAGKQEHKPHKLSYAYLKSKWVLWDKKPKSVRISLIGHG